MEHARGLIEEVKAALRPAESRILQHPYIEALEQGRVPRERLRLFAGEQYHIVKSDVRSIALMVARFGGPPHRDFFVLLLQGDLAGHQGILDFATGLGLTDAWLEEYEPAPSAHAYTAYLAWLGLYASEAEVAAAFLVNLRAWGANCARMGKALREQYGLGEKAISFFTLFGTPAPALEERALAVVDHGLRRGAEPRAIRRAARLIQGYELMFWDTTHQLSIS